VGGTLRRLAAKCASLAIRGAMGCLLGPHQKKSDFAFPARCWITLIDSVLEKKSILSRLVWSVRIQVILHVIVECEAEVSNAWRMSLST
jgi:hypothetical protein